MNKDERMKLPKLTSLDDLLSTQEERDAKNTEKITMIPIKNLVPFKNHPFKVRDDEEMDNLVESIKNIGVKTPLRIRAKEDGKYEIVSGHRRLKAGLKAGLDNIPCIVENMSDDEAVIVMVDSNLQREKILPSEKAFAYKMRLEAMKRQAGRPKKEDNENSVPTAQDLKGKTSREILGEEVGESQDQIRRYIRLTELIPEILELVDEEKMKLRPAVEISYLQKGEQEYLLETIEYTEVFPSHPQARELKKLSEQGNLTEDEIDRIMSAEKPNQKEQVKVPDEELQPYYPKDVISVEQKRKYVIHCVRKVSELEEKQRQRRMEDAR